MFITGYHGTTMDSANNIINGEGFWISKGDTEWLGKGIYYYFDISDAYEWKDAEAILHSVIKIDDKEYLDIDTKEGAGIFNQMIDHIADKQDKAISNSLRYAQQNQCAVMKMLWDSCPQIKVVSASFHKKKTKVRTLLDRRDIRKEFCVRNNDCIKCTQLIQRGDLDD